MLPTFQQRGVKELGLGHENGVRVFPRHDHERHMVRVVPNSPLALPIRSLSFVTLSYPHLTDEKTEPELR